MTHSPHAAQAGFLCPGTAASPDTEPGALSRTRAAARLVTRAEWGAEPVPGRDRRAAGGPCWAGVRNLVRSAGHEPLRGW
ncbi:hypothetical protein [Amycolatopsis sp. WGS_07]|uniref:hypothetical protein n=1 Tax=Amycolatopsis sp. WGS_07 TaxID=3076764 RepID=UPI0038737A32